MTPPWRSKINPVQKDHCSEDASMKHHEQLRKILFGSLPFEFLGMPSQHLRSSSCDFNAVHCIFAQAPVRAGKDIQCSANKASVATPISCRKPYTLPRSCCRYASLPETFWAAILVLPALVLRTSPHCFPIISQIFASPLPWNTPFLLFVKSFSTWAMELPVVEAYRFGTALIQLWAPPQVSLI